MKNFEKNAGLNFSNSEMKSNKQVIVIADADLSTRIFLKLKLEEAGYEIKETKTGAEAWDIISSKNISLLIMEMKLPELHGSDLLKNIKKKSPKLPVIIYTEHEEFSADMTVVTFPNHEYMMKPTPIEKILRTIKLLLESPIN
ncbi:MAG: hypothetical protein COA79_18580 [Planctomycetota bacterium]|nr:MAG: hypothetical protein COA79_18580 [Planctomycetota bacterium]